MYHDNGSSSFLSFPLYIIHTDGSPYSHVPLHGVTPCYILRWSHSL